MKTSAMALALVTAQLALQGASASAHVADGPPAGAASYNLLRYECVTDAEFQSRVIVKARTHLKSVPPGSNTYYQEVYVQVDGQSARGWKKIQGKEYSWSRVKRGDLATYSTSALRAAVNGGSTYRGKFTVKLRQVRTGPDPVKWQYSFVTPGVDCGAQFRGPMNAQVTKAEYSKIKMGMSIAKVTAVAGVRGKSSGPIGHCMVRRYTGWQGRTVSIRFYKEDGTWEVSAKSAEFGDIVLNCLAM